MLEPAQVLGAEKEGWWPGAESHSDSKMLIFLALQLAI